MPAMLAMLAMPAMPAITVTIRATCLRCTRFPFGYPDSIMAAKAQGQVHRRDILGDVADRNEIHAGLRDSADIGKIDATRGLQPGAPTGFPNGRFQFRDAEIIEQDVLGAGRERIA